MSAVLLAPGISSRVAEGLLVAQPIRIIHENHRSKVAEVELRGERFARKVYRARSPFLAPFLPCPARRTWNLLLRGAEKGLPFPAPIAFVGRPLSLSRRRGAVVITRWFNGDHLHLTHARERVRLADPLERREFAAAIADAQVALYSAGVRTTDLAPQNLLVGRIDGAWRACLVDLDDVELDAAVDAAAIIENLAQLGHLPETITPRERLLGLQLFLERGGALLLEEWIAEHSENELRRTIAERITEFSSAKKERLRTRGADDHAHSGFGLDADGNPIR